MPETNRNLRQAPSSRNFQVNTVRAILLTGVLFAGVLGIMQIDSSNGLETSLEFTNTAISGTGNAGTAIAIGGRKDGGFAWGDINQDGYLDLVVNTRQNSSSFRTRIYISDPTDPANPVFVDKTEELCKGCRNDYTERCAILADINHDGNLDLIRNRSTLLEIYLNQGAAAGFAFGVGIDQTPHLALTTPGTGSASGSDIPGGMNTEGIFLADYNNNGWLDLIIENHNWGIDVFQNPADGSANFFHVDPVSLGLPVSATDGDYGTCVDFDDDGDIDIIARKRNENDFFLNNGGTFANGQDIEDANNGNKGGVVFADFDNDGDFDLYWTDNGPNQIWLNDGSGTLSASNSGGTGEPWLSSGISAPASGIDGAAVGDVNNDGKADLFLSDASGSSYLFVNQTPDGGTLSFVQENFGIDISGNAEGAAFADYDNDGDLDLYVNVDDGNNQLWRNSLNNQNYLKIDARISLGSNLYRSAVGANILLKDCRGNVISGIREVPTTSGHGTDAADLVHFGLPFGPDTTYNIEVHFVAVNGSRKIVERSMTPSDFTNHTVIIYDTDASLFASCLDTDQDGVLDAVDLDDDNDGIPDVLEQYCADASMANSTSGQGAYQDQIYWFNWTDPDFSDGLQDGDTQTFTLSNGTIVTATISSVINLGNQGGERYIADDMNTWSGAKMHKLYNTDGAHEVFHSGGTTRDNVSFAITFSATKNGRPVFLDYVFVDGESTNGAGEYIKSVTNQGNWVVLEHFAKGATFTGAGTQVLNITNTESRGAGNSVFYAKDATVFSISINNAGGQAVGFGIFLECDSDGDGIFNHLDLDSDNDGIPDIVEAGGADVNGDGIADDLTDSDGDGLVDIFETSAGYTSILFDQDENGAHEYDGDFDQDGLPNWADLDSDGDGIVDIIETGGPDNNQDGIVDGFATDVDLDGYGDAVDGDVGNDGNAENSSNALLLTSADLDKNGVPDTGYPVANADGNGYPNFIDIDADDDGLTDNTEAQITEGYIAPTGRDDDQDGIDNAYDNAGSTPGGSGLIPVNIDVLEDAIPDYLDNDADNDLQPDVIEGHDSDGDGIGDANSPSGKGVFLGVDVDLDGLDDGFDNRLRLRDATNGQTKPKSHPRIGGGKDQDWRVQVFLPVEWVSFDAVWQGQYALLNWQTAMEMNASHFQIERSWDGEEIFKVVGRTDAIGNSTEIQSYEFLDTDFDQIMAGSNVSYRLKQIDLDGKYEYSKVVELRTAGQELRLKVYPNPASDRSTVQIQSGLGEQVLKVLSLSGKKMFEKRISNNETEVPLDMSRWPQGVYIVHLSNEYSQTTERLVKK